MLRVLLLVFFLYSSLFSKEYILKKGWNLIGTANEEIILDSNNSSIENIFSYSNGNWKVFPKVDNYEYLTSIKPYSGAWILSEQSSSVSFKSLQKNIQTISLVSGWNLISLAVSVDELLNNSKVVLIWKYTDGKWYYATNDNTIDQILFSNGYSKMLGIENGDGAWVYAYEATTISVSNTENYFYGKTIDNVYTGATDDIIIVSSQYPLSNYGTFLKNNKEIGKDDLILKSVDMLSFVPNKETSLDFVNLDDLVISYLPLNGDIATQNSFKIIMPKFSDFYLTLDDNNISSNQIFIGETGTHQIKVGLIDQYGNMIKNCMIYLKVDNNYKDRFDTLQAFTGDDGIATFNYKISQLKNESFNVQFYFFDAFKSKWSRDLVIKSSTMDMDLFNDIILINKPSIQYEIKGLIYDKITKAPITNTELNISYIPLKSGELSSYSVKSDNNGYFSIIYTSPKDINISDITITIYNDFISKEIILNFENESNEVDNNTYIINSTINTLNIFQPSEQKTIELYVYKVKDNMSLPYDNIYVNVNFIGDILGSFDSYSKKTDNSGKVSFIYTAPNIIDNLSNLTARFYIADKSYVDKNITISFSPLGITESTKLQLTPQEINVTSSSTEYQVKVLVIDQNNKPLQGVNVNILGELISNGVDYGSINKSQIITDENGVATFVYTSPKDSKLLYGFSKDITVNIEDTNISKKITINYNQPPNTSTVAKLILDPSSFTVNSSIDQQITVYTFDSSDKPISTEVYVGSLISDNNLSIYGEITPAIFRTDENGKAVLTYKTPANMESFSGEIKDIKISTGNDVYANLTLVFPPKNDIATKIILSPSNIKVVDGLNQNIDILTLTNSNQPISAKVNIPVPFDSDGVLLGTFDSYSLETDTEGKASVIYSAPTDLSNLKGEKNITISTENGTASTTLTLDFSNISTTSAKDYKIKLTPPNSIEVSNSGTIVVDIVEKDNEVNYINSINVNSVKLEIVNHLLSFDENNIKESYEYNSSSRKNIDVFSKYNSGIEIIKVTANIFNGESNVTISDSFPVTILSGPVSAISMVYNGTEYNAPFFEDKYTLHAVDKYGNPAKKGTRINVGAISGVRKDYNDKYLKVDKNGSLGLGDNNTSEFNITDSSYNLHTVQDKYNNNEGSDTLIILANDERFSPLYLGGWIVEETKDNNTTLLLDGNFSSDKTETDKLSFVIGNEKRYNVCEQTYNVIDFDEQDKTYLLDDNGNANLIVRYDPFFVGHDIFLYANSISDQNRVGVSIRKKLSGTGINATNFICDGRKEDTNCTKPIKITSAGNGNVLKDVEFNINNFSYKKVVIDNVTYSCNPIDFSIVNENTQCDGYVWLKIEVKQGDACEVYWNGSIPYEY